MSSREFKPHSVGTTAERPADAQNGWTHYNTDTGDYEIYNGSAWKTIMNLVGNNAGTSTMVQVRVQSITVGDTISVKLWDSTGTPMEVGPAFNVGAPTMIQQSRWDAVSARRFVTYASTGNIKRTATWNNGVDPPEVEEQTVVPSYEVGDIIYVMNRCIGGLDYVGSVSPEVDYIDINVDGRVWSEDTEA
jgi:hypothetical protein